MPSSSSNDPSANEQPGPAPPLPFPRPDGGSPTPRGRLPGVEGLRALAASAVVIQHVWVYDGGERLGAGGLSGGLFLNLALGVVLFFALSGFLLYRPFAAAIARGTRSPEIGTYLRNRALRIVPAYWVILLASALVLRSATLREDGHLASGTLTDPLHLGAAALLVHGYVPGTVAIGIGPAWSLAVEAVFYLVLPVLAIGAARFALRESSRSRRVAILLVPPLLLLLVGLSGKFVAGVVLSPMPADGYESDWYSVLMRSFLAQADLFSFGMVAAVLYSEVADGRIRLPRGWRTASLGLALAIAVPCALTLGSGQLNYPLQNTGFALAAALLLAAVTFPGDGRGTGRLRRVLETRAVVAVGLASYSVFLWNEPVVRWLERYGVMRDGWPGLVWNLVVTAMLVGALSVATYCLVERPALRRKRRRSPGVRTVAAAPPAARV